MLDGTLNLTRVDCYQFVQLPTLSVNRNMTGYKMRTFSLVVVACVVWSSSFAGSANKSYTIHDRQQGDTTKVVGPTADAGGDLFIVLPDNSVTLLGTGSSPDGYQLKYVWSQLSGPVKLSIADSTSQNIVLNNLPEGAYVLELKVTDTSGQTGRDQIKITVADNASADIQSAIPRYFSPNGDGINDTWEWPETDLFKKSILMIFDRTGKRVFDDANYANQWDGKYNGRPLPDDIYFYTIRLYKGANIMGSVRIVR